MKVAVIIKHPYRDHDWRIDMVEVDEKHTSEEEIRKVVEREMLGPFEIMGITTRITDRNISEGLERIRKDQEKQINT